MVSCPSCHQDNPEGAKFCLNCGTALAPAPAPRVERRVVTVLFCDLVGFTARSDSADPEDVRATLRPFHAVARREIERHGGTLDKFIGDAAMGVFGSPIAHEDDPERAVRTALALVESIREINEGRDGPPLEVRVGVNTGEAMATLAAGVQEGENVAGDVVNTASRLQSVAPVGRILVGEKTFHATSDLIEYEALGPVTVKGKAEPLAVWRVIGARAPVGEVFERRHRTPFVGREQERSMLEGALQRSSSTASVQLVTLVGEPGAGKSRLVAEVRSAAGRFADRVQWRQGRCLPYGEGVTFWAIGEVVKTHAGIVESDPPAARDAKLASALRGLAVDRSERAWLRARLGPLAGLEADAVVDREESFAAWRRFLEAVASAEPLVVVVEDLHWADPAALSFLEGLVERVHGVPMLVIATARPELFDRHPAWGTTAPSALRIALSPLNAEETARLVAGLLDRRVLPAETQALLVERSGGNPLYAEEFARMLTDRGFLDERGRLAGNLAGVAFPESLQALIAARLDTLTAERKALLQDASVIGKVFWSGAVAHLAAREEGVVRDELAELIGREYVRRADVSGVAGQAEYAFWHAMVRDVAYGQMARAARARKHGAAAAWIETIARDRAPDLAEILAHHGTVALELARAAGETTELPQMEEAARRYLRAAGKYAMALDVARAEDHLRRALELTPAGHPDRPPIEAGLGEAAFQAGRLGEAERLLREAVDGFRSEGRVAEAADAAIRLSVVIEYGGDPSAGRIILAEAIATLERLPPGPELARALAESAGTLMVAARYSEVVADADRAIELARSVGEAEAEARASNFRGYARVALGDLGGLDELRESVEVARALGLGRATAVSYSNLGAALFLTEGARPSLECGREGVAFAEARGLLEMAAFLRNGMLTCLRYLGEWDEVLALGARVAEDARRGGAEYEEVFADVDRTYVLLLRGEPGAPGAAESLLARTRPMEDPPLLALAMTIAAMGRSASGDLAGGAALVREIIDITGGDAIMDRAAEVCDLVRVAMTAGQPGLAMGALEGVDGLRLPRHQNAIVSARAVVMEADGSDADALALYREAAQRWEVFGHVLERGQDLFGAGRCLRRLGRSDEAAEALAQAGQAFTRLGAAPLLAELAVWIEDAPAQELPG